MRAISRENRKHYLSNVWAQLDLLSTIRREVEHEDGEEADAHTGDDQVDGVEESLPPHGDVEGDVQVGLVTAGVELDISLGRNLQDVPLHGHVELSQVDTDVHRGAVLRGFVGRHRGGADLFLVPEVNLANIFTIRQLAQACHSGSPSGSNWQVI